MQCELRQQGIVSGPVTGQVQISNGRSVPLDDCRERLTPWLGAPASIVNRFGKDGVQSERYDEGGALADRPIIAKAFGFKQWAVGKHTFNLGGFYTWQSGIAWGRVEGRRNAAGRQRGQLERGAVRQRARHLQSSRSANAARRATVGST